MTLMGKEYIQFAEVLLSIFTIDQGNLKILLLKKPTGIYKGYWCLPSSLVKNNESLDNVVSNCAYEKTGIKKIYTEQNYIFDDINRSDGSRLFGISYIGLIDSLGLMLYQEKNNIELSWFNINTLPKLAFDHNEIVSKSIKYLKHELLNVNILKQLFPADFTLPELQKIYEQLLNIKIDRRNFRKKILNLNIIEDINENIVGVTGRPAKLYKFKDNVKDIYLF